MLTLSDTYKSSNFGRPRKRFGQNFLRDPHVLGRLVAALEPETTDAWLEIGPGRGALTEHLLPCVAAYHAVELDRDLCTYLRHHYGARLRLHEGDVLNFSPDQTGLEAPYRLVGNLPYNISTPLLLRLASWKPAFHDAFFMLQREVAQRLAAAPGEADYGRLTVMMAQDFCCTPLFSVPPEAFDPAPKVMSSVVRLTPHTEAHTPYDRVLFADVVRLAFGQRRKQLRNSLRDLGGAAVLEEAGLDPSARAETLSLKDYIQLTQKVSVCLQNKKNA